MQQKYQDWIDENVHGSVLGRCANVTKTMLEAFPELTRVRGQFMCLVWGPRNHWWLVDPDGDIIDPTVTQFPSASLAAPSAYVLWDESQPEPTGKCPNCGEYCWDGNYCCSRECERDYDAYMNDCLR